MTVSLRAVATATTRLAGVARVNKHERHAALVALVGEELRELEIGPTAVGAPLPLSNLCEGASPDAVQVLARDRAARRLGRVGDRLRDSVRYVGLKAPFLPGPAFEQTASALGARLLQLTSGEALRVQEVALMHP